MPSPPNDQSTQNNYGWTPESRAAARERALLHKPWEHSTGPKTDAGKARIAQNARKYPLQNAEILRLSREMIALNQAFLVRSLAFFKINDLHWHVKRVRPRTSKNKLIEGVLNQWVKK